MCLVHFCLIVDFMIVMPIGPTLMRSFNIGPKEFSQMIMAFTLCAGLSGILGSLFLDRFERRSCMIWSLAAFLATNLVTAFSETHLQFIVARALTGATVGIAGSLIMTIVSDTIQIEKRATAIGYVMSAFALASILGVPLGLVLANRLTWQSPFVAIAALCGLSIFLSYRWIPKMGQHLPTNSSTISQFVDLVANSNRLRALAFMVFLILGHFSINPFLFPSVVANCGVSEQQLPVVYLFAGIGSIVASISFGRWSDRFGRSRVFITALLLSVAPILLVTHVFPKQLVLVTVFISSFFILMGGRLTPAMTMITATVKQEMRARFLSLISSIQHLAAALGAFVAGQVVEKSSSGIITNFSKVGYFAVFCSLIALYISRNVNSSE
jgi:MFS transporter, DHA1 family, inner membrane transport protein